MLHFFYAGLIQLGYVLKLHRLNLFISSIVLFWKGWQMCVCLPVKAPAAKKKLSRAAHLSAL